MQPWKKLACLIIICSFCTTSCWNSRELDELAIVTGVAIDLGSEEGTVDFTSQIIIPAKIKTGAEQSSEPMPYFNLTSSGRTVFEAIRKGGRMIDRRMYFPHSRVLLISEEAARQGVSQYLDLLMRDPEFRRDSFVLITRGRAADVFTAKTQLKDLPGISIYDLVQRRKGASLASGVTLLEFVQRLMSKTTAPLASLLEFNKDTKQVTLSGTAVFKKDKLVDYLTGTQTRGLLWVLNKVKAGIVVVDCPDKDGKISLEIVGGAGQIQPRLKNGQILIELKIRVEVHLAEQSCPGDMTTPANSDYLKKELEKAVESEITAALSKARELNCDIFGFGTAINKKYPQHWREMEKDWEQIFSELDILIKVEPMLTRSGMTTKTARPD